MAIAHIPVFYRPEMTARSQFFAPGTIKPAACVDDWLANRLPIEVRDFSPATRANLALAHDQDYVDGVLDCRVRNGFGGFQQDVAASLPFTTGAMMAAAEEALLAGGVACAPVSGFHHAHWAESSGFCTFNGLVVTARHLLEVGYARRIGILDLDQHWGDGTEAILQRLRIDRVVHDSVGREPRGPRDAEPFLKGLAKRVRRFERCQVLLYQAGADPHVDDPLGGWMTSEQLARRDQIVFETTREMGLPVAWNLAGGYQRDEAGTIAPVLAIHRRTMEVCCSVFGNAPLDARAQT
jgi:acetoin utilization deacetylase AcuC-like enzyme